MVTISLAQALHAVPAMAYPTRVSHDPNSYLELASSRGRAWAGCDAYLYQGAVGKRSQPMTHHSFLMHVGNAALVKLRCEQHEFVGLMRDGHVGFFPQATLKVRETPHANQTLMVDLDPHLVDAVAGELDVGTAPFGFTPNLTVDDQRITHIMRAMLAELQAEFPLGRLYAESLAVTLATWLIKAPLSGRTTPLASRNRLDDLLEFIRENLAEDLSLTSLASVAGVSRSHFKRLFKGQVGMSAHQYVLRLRVERAVSLISSTEMPLTQVAFECGFCNPSHLAASLRKLQGLSPVQLRRDLKSA